MEKIGENVRIKRIAITGRPAAGKSAACKLIADLGAFVIYADEIVHHLYQNDPECKQQVVEALGDGILEDGEISRKKVADIVFQQPEKLTQIEQIVHPKVIDSIKESFGQVSKREGVSAFVCEFPLLFETKFDTWFDTSIYVDADPDLCEERFAGQGFSRNEFQKRSTRFLPREEGRKRADVVITNDGSIDDLRAKLSQVLP